MTRKYRQQGYQDSDRDRDERPRRRPPSRPLTPEERAQRRGLRHALDREASEVVRCHDCGRNIDTSGPIAKDASCPNCNAVLHCCRACQQFDTGARWQCKASITAPVPDKGKANDCTFFTPRRVLDATGKRGQKTSRLADPRDPKSQFENLFKR